MTTSIEWTDVTWNPVRGCTRVSEGCRHCYAERQAMRFAGEHQSYDGLVSMTNGHPQWTGVIRTLPEKLSEPFRWKKPSRVFVNSMSDLFHEGVPEDFLDQIFAVMALSSKHTFQVLTKRPERMLDYFRLKPAPPLSQCTEARVGRMSEKLASDMLGEDPSEAYWDAFWDWPLPNVWLGVSVENQKYANERIPLLLQTPAAVRFLSVEPMLERVDLTAIRRTHAEGFMRPLDGRFRTIDWVICGGESGPGARPFNLAWAESLRDQCKTANVPFFMKQCGSFPVRETPERITWKWDDRKGGDPSEWPEDLRIREFPNIDISKVSTPA